MKRFCPSLVYSSLAVAALMALGGWAVVAPARAAPPTVTPSPGYDARLQEQRAAASAIYKRGSATAQTFWNAADILQERDVIPRVPPVEASFPGFRGAGLRCFTGRCFVRRNRCDRLLPNCFSFFLGAFFRISRRRAEQRLLQFVDAFRKPRPFAGE